MTEVFLHVYDVANSESVKTNNAIVQLNKIFKDGIGLGGIFHSAIEVYGKMEWSFGFCESGSGVFSCHRKENPMYVYRESLSLGHTQLSPEKVRECLINLSAEWQGCKYDLLSKNCNHFCNDFCTSLGVQKLPGWVNRFANAGETAVDVAETTMKRLRQARTEVVSASKVAYRAVFGGAFGSAVSPEPGMLEGSSSSNGGGNLLHLPFMKTPVSLFSKIGLGAASQSMNERVQSDELLITSNENGSVGRSMSARVQGDKFLTSNKNGSADHSVNERVQEDGSTSKKIGSVDVQSGGVHALGTPPS